MGPGEGDASSRRGNRARAADGRWRRVFGRSRVRFAKATSSFGSYATTSPCRSRPWSTSCPQVEEARREGGARGCECHEKARAKTPSIKLRSSPRLLHNSTRNLARHDTSLPPLRHARAVAPAYVGAMTDAGDAGLAPLAASSTGSRWTSSTSSRNSRRASSPSTARARFRVHQLRARRSVGRARGPEVTAARALRRR